MQDRQPLRNDRDLERARKNNRFRRQEDLHDAIHRIHLKIVKCIAIVFFVLFVLNLFQLPAWINTDFVDRSVYALGGTIFGSLLSRIKEQTL